MRVQKIDRDMLRLEREFGRKRARAGLHKGRLTFSTSSKARKRKKSVAGRRKS